MTRPSTFPDPAGVRVGPDFAAADAVRRVAAAERAIIDAEADRERAAVEYTVAGSRWESARLGVHPDTGNPPTGTQLEDLRQAVDTAL